MLPTQGYFKHITCPYYDSGLCERPHCQFRHAKKGEAETASVVTTESETKMFDSHGASEDKADMGQSILEQLVSETVKKVLSHPEILPGAITSGSVKSISQSLVNKVVGELKPKTSFVVHTASAVVESPPDSPESHTVYIPSTSVPSYRPTPIAELKKRQGSVPYKPHTSSKSRLKRRNRDYSQPHSKYSKSELCTETEDWKKLPYIPKAIGSSHPKYSPTHNDYSSSSKVLSYIPSSISSLSSDSNDYVPLPLTSTLSVPDYHPSNISCSSKEVNYVPQGLESEDSYIPTISCSSKEENYVPQGLESEDSYIPTISCSSKEENYVPQGLESEDSYIPTISCSSKDANYVPQGLESEDSYIPTISCASKEASYVPQGLETEPSYIPTIRSELENMSRTNNTVMLNSILSESMAEDQNFFVEDCEVDSKKTCERTKEKDCKGDKEKDCGNFTALSGQILPAEKKKKVKSGISGQTIMVKTPETKQQNSNSSSKQKSKSHSSCHKHAHVSNKHKEMDIKVKKPEHKSEHKSKKVHKEEKSEKKSAKCTSSSHKNSSSDKVTVLNSKKVKYKDAQSRIEKQKTKHRVCNSKSASKTSAPKSPKKQEDESKSKRSLHIKDNHYLVESPKVKEKSSSSSLKEKGYGRYEATLKEIMGSSIDEDSFNLNLSESDEETVREECFRIFQEYNPQPLSTMSVKEVAPKPSQKPERQKLDKSRVGIPATKTKTESSSKHILKQTPVVTKLGEPKGLNSSSGVSSLTSRMCSTASTIQKQIATQQPNPTARIRIASVQNVERLLSAKHRMKAELESRQKSKTSHSSATFLKESSGSAKQQQYSRVPQFAKTDSKKMCHHQQQQHKKRFLGDREAQ